MLKKGIDNKLWIINSQHVQLVFIKKSWEIHVSGINKGQLEKFPYVESP